MTFVPDYNKFRIFQIGFNKCGTTSFFKLFKQNGIPSVHYDNGELANTIYNNYINKKPLLDSKYKKKVFFSDMENIYNPNKLLYIARDYYKQLDREYPNSKFILNIRARDKWLLSRYNHDNGLYLKSVCIFLNKSEDEILEQWKNEWDTHNLNVISYFKNRPNDLLIFNIEKDPPMKIHEFFKSNIDLNMSYFGHYGKTYE